jgi:8-oxo-dGTP diphosphatase
MMDPSNDTPAPAFTIRVYGLLLHAMGPGDEMHVLVSDEVIKGRQVTKFPGGGLEFGEGLKDCLVREIREELGQDAFGLEHFYTTDFFQQSTFHTRPLQVISVYYTFRVRDPLSIHLLSSPFAYERPGVVEGSRWLPLRSSTDGDMHLPIDRVVLAMLRERGGQFNS